MNPPSTPQHDDTMRLFGSGLLIFLIVAVIAGVKFLVYDQYFSNEKAVLRALHGDREKYEKFISLKSERLQRKMLIDECASRLYDPIIVNSIKWQDDVRASQGLKREGIQGHCEDEADEILSD